MGEHCPACERESERVYRCEHCGHDLVDEGRGDGRPVADGGHEFETAQPRGGQSDGNSHASTVAAQLTADQQALVGDSEPCHCYLVVPIDGRDWPPVVEDDYPRWTERSAFEAEASIAWWEVASDAE